ncbi:MAG: ParB/RepB/Spo0J family partition protein [Propionibacteriaceae bacterium]|jgi:ParB family chromosome partitioning protein|nr:ParB/RepB/Spo0J family partition protein [Propionibacteriaceae bacterium]
MPTAKHPTGLGRGLGELFANTSPASADSEPQYREIKLAMISPNPQQPRQVFDPEQLDELAASIKEVGLLQPIVVRPVDGGRFELIMGERRWRASQMAGLDTVPAIIRATEQVDLLRDALLENIHRVQLNPLEEAAAYQQLMTDFDITQEELSTQIKRSRPQIANLVRLLRLPATVQSKVAAGVISAGHARALLGLEDADAMETLAHRIIAEGLSVRATEELVTLMKGAKPKAARRARHAKAEHPRSAPLAAALSDIYDTRVQVDIGKNKGKITIEFAGEDDLDRILGIIDPELD